jgi:NAD(P)-dependent dehydrogenase (short-subunit alcohol dehydrogenase family)
MAPQVWLITGASSGFGALLAEKALQAGHYVIATARNPTKAAQDYPQVTSLGGKWLQLDVTSKSTKDQVQQAVKEHGGRIDVVINNAGYGLLGSIEDIRYGRNTQCGYTQALIAQWLMYNIVKMSSIRSSRPTSMAWFGS